MIGLLLTIKAIFAQIMEFGWWLALGASIAVLAGLFRGLLGYIGIGIGGAAIMFVALSSNWLADDSDRVKALEAALKDAEIAAEISEAAAVQAEKDLVAEMEAAEHNANVIATLRDRLEKMDDKPDCTIDKGFFDELDKMR